MDKLQALISQNDWVLQCWDDRYSRGIWAIIAPHTNHVYEIREITDGRDIESMEIGEYFHNEGSWLPVVIGENLAEVLIKLNEKVTSYAENNLWKNKVYDAFQRIIEVNDGNYGL
ncbi:MULTISPECIES: hypothetical protein [Bacillus]|uniref:hypothetical protein n=1 Tax=Bacillus TaxID=1386 RepID=UPI000C782EBA|nr:MULTISPECIES: hypothetical protein [Bacillus]MCP1161221.1 hypothetical protein [Bacillus infantis]PLR70544.1 hypothetical protein CYJ37_23715 [Bacillus sp. UMB0728]